MQTKYGMSRVALLIPSLGIAVKFPRIYGLTILKQLYYGYLKRRAWKDLRWFITAPTNRMGSLRFMILNGLICNLSEFWFYFRTKNEFAWPTSFSLLGIFNIQKLGECPPIGEALDIHHVIMDIAGSDIKDAHCFTDVSNFAVSKKTGLYLLDYASPNSQAVLEKHGREFRERFSNYYEEMSHRKELRKDNPFY